MTIREATLEDVEAINQLNTGPLNHEYPLADAKKQLCYLLSSPVNKLFVKELDEKVVGYIQLSEYVSTYAPRLMNVLALVVAEDFHSQGLGKALLDYAEQWAKEQGVKGIRLNSGVERTAAHKFYEKQEYVRVKNQVNFRKLFNERISKE
ncbi:GNAT family N-acetyltransferase [Enterococcus ureilyticus]|uniref:GNAT family N-acetyltransferase n=1 Tax=Enterococcus ureilyticus TaxID=1131292 RepID=A0A1E5HFQ7_9ENTE|nr:GNAT family N-acetyltransferase [Enterococcus ureilyticus]MBM7689372.1 ribosomal protein S18 acetylase RimI-like enzyme [Enterococcus ureilyticus]MBO0444814.1 GNAT family N-acetyltransferase [Enterococcus ureilyticus]OEG23771.1 GNAT family N-acetyltransferase [Enterococcus ureilyticus]